MTPTRWARLPEHQRLQESLLHCAARAVQLAELLEDHLKAPKPVDVFYLREKADQLEGTAMYMVNDLVYLSGVVNHTADDATGRHPGEDAI